MACHPPCSVRLERQPRYYIRLWQWLPVHFGCLSLEPHDPWRPLYQLWCFCAIHICFQHGRGHPNLGNADTDHLGFTVGEIQEGGSIRVVPIRGFVSQLHHSRREIR